MLEAGGGLDLALEASGAEGLREVRQEHLERDRAFMAKVMGQVDRGHATPPEFALEAVAISEGSGELSREIGHALLRPGGADTLPPSVREG